MKKDWLCVLACYILWGVSPLFWSFVGQINSLCILGWRSVWSLALVIWVISRGRLWSDVWKTMQNKRLFGRIALAGLVMFGNWGLYVWSVSHGHRIEASLAYYLMPMFAVLLGMVIYGERLTKRQWTAMAITMVGVGFAIVNTGQFPWIPVILGSSVAIYGAIKKPIKLQYQVVMAVETFAVVPFAILILIVCGPMGWHPDYSAMGWQLILIPLCGLVSFAPLMFFGKGIGGTSMTLSGILMYINPTLQMMVALSLGDPFTWQDGVLFGFVWLGVLVYIVPDLWQLYKHRGETLCE